VASLSIDKYENIWIGTTSGGIVVFNENGIVSVEDNDRFNTTIPNDYILSENYPNPFNPKTNIKFSIPRTEFVTLKIYNILGQEVSTLVSEKLTPGNYKYEWDASGFASGIYYYTLETTKGFVQSKKLILIK